MPQQIQILSQLINSLLHSLIFFFLLDCVTCGILVPQSEIKSMLHTTCSGSLKHWTDRESPTQLILLCFIAIWEYAGGFFTTQSLGKSLFLKENTFQDVTKIYLKTNLDYNPLYNQWLPAI